MRILRNLWTATLAAALGGTPAAAAGNTAYAPPLSGITVDGDLSDWPQACVEVPIAATGAIYGGHSDLLGQDLLSSSDLSAGFRVGYDPGQDLIYVAVRVRDDFLISGTGWTQTDATEIYLGGAGPVRQYFMVPGEGAYSAGYENPGLMGEKWSRTRAQGAWRRSGEVTTYEWAVEAFDQPGSPVDLRPGLSLPFDVAIADRDGADDAPAWITWGPYVVQKFSSSSRVGTLVLLAPNEPLASLTGSVSLTGHLVQARDGDRVVGAAPVRADGTFEMRVPSGQYRLTVGDDESMVLAARPVMAQTGDAPTVLAAALVRAQPPEPGTASFGGNINISTGGAGFDWESAMETTVWIVLLAGIFTFLIYRQVLVNRTRQMAIQAGQPLPEPRASDPRKMALILIALGASFAIAIGTTLALVHDSDAPPPLAVAIWGLVPVLLGGALWAYRALAAGEKR